MTAAANTPDNTWLDLKHKHFKKNYFVLFFSQLSLRHFKCNELHGTYDIYFLKANDIYKVIVWLKMWLVGTSNLPGYLLHKNT